MRVVRETSAITHAVNSGIHILRGEPGFSESKKVKGTFREGNEMQGVLLEIDYEFQRVQGWNSGVVKE